MANDINKSKKDAENDSKGNPMTRKIRAVGFGRNYYFPLYNSESSSSSCDPGGDSGGGDSNSLPWKDGHSSLPLSITCSAQSTIVVVTENGGTIYQRGTLHGRVRSQWTRLEIPLPLRCAQVAAGRHFCLARMEGGKAVLAWGAGHFGQLGVLKQQQKAHQPMATTTTQSPSNIAFASEPVLIERLLPSYTGSTIQSIAAGDWHGMALTTAGQVWTWGLNRSLQCGLKFNTANTAATSTSTMTVALPVPIALLPPMKQIAAGKAHSCALTTGTGKVYCWGSSHFGQCGRGVTSRRNVAGLLPTPVEGLPSTLEIVKIDAAGNHCMSLSKAGRVFVWGDGQEGQLGISLATNNNHKNNKKACLSDLQYLQANRPRLVVDIDFVAVAAGQQWKQQQQQQQQQSSTTATVAETLSSVPTIVSIHAGATYSAATSSSGHVYCWGSNDVGQLGLKAPTNLRDVESCCSTENHNENDDSSSNAPLGQHQPLQQPIREMHVRTFDSNHNVLLPSRVPALDDLHVTTLALGPNHMFCWGRERPPDDAQKVGQTLYELQNELWTTRAHRHDASPTVPLKTLAALEQPESALDGKDDKLGPDDAAAISKDGDSNDPDSMSSNVGEELLSPRDVNGSEILDDSRHGAIQNGESTDETKCNGRIVAVSESAVLTIVSSVPAATEDEIAASLASYNSNNNSHHFALVLENDAAYANAAAAASNATSPSSVSTASFLSQPGTHFSSNAAASKQQYCCAPESSSSPNSNGLSVGNSTESNNSATATTSSSKKKLGLLKRFSKGFFTRRKWSKRKAASTSATSTPTLLPVVETNHHNSSQGET